MWPFWLANARNTHHRSGSRRPATDRVKWGWLKNGPTWSRWRYLTIDSIMDLVPITALYMQIVADIYIYIYIHIRVFHIHIHIHICFLYPTISQKIGATSQAVSGFRRWSLPKDRGTGQGTGSGGNTDPSWWGWRDMKKEMETSGKKCENLWKLWEKDEKSRCWRKKTWIWSTKIVKGQARHKFYPSPDTG